MRVNGKEIWFPAKKYGWGWGLPCTWQGWGVLAIFFFLSVTSSLLLARGHRDLWIASLGLLVTALIAISFAKGEKPRWRRGEEKVVDKRSVSEQLVELEKLYWRRRISDKDFEARLREIMKHL